MSSKECVLTKNVSRCYYKVLSVGSMKICYYGVLSIDRTDCMNSKKAY